MSMAPKVGYAVTATRHSCESMSTTVLGASAIQTRSVANQCSNMRSSGNPPYHGAETRSSQLRPSLNGIHPVPEGGGPSLKSITKRRAESCA
eukprot:3248094-Pleurochrysis_carterae.AAC.1